MKIKIGEKNHQVVVRIQKKVGIIISIIYFFVILLNALILASLNRSPGEIILDSTTLPFLVLLPLSVLSIFFIHGFYRIYHIFSFLAAALFASLSMPMGNLVGPVLYIIGMILMLQYGYLSRHPVWRVTAVILPYAVIVIGGSALTEDSGVLNGISTVIIMLMLFSLFYSVFSEEIRESLLKNRVLSRELQRNQIFIHFGRNVVGVVHNLKSSLMSVNGFAELIEQNPCEETGEYAALQREATRNMIGMVENLMFAVRSSQETQEKDVQLARLSRGVIELLKANMLFKQNIRFIEEMDDDARVRISPLDFMQILQNLLTNAVEAVKEIPGSKVVLKSWTGSDYVWLSVSDNGNGIPWILGEPPQNCLKNDVFRLGQSSKPEGSGVGMVYVQDLIRSKNGVMTAESTADGTTITLGFPAPAQDFTKEPPGDEQAEDSLIS